MSFAGVLLGCGGGGGGTGGGPTAGDCGSAAGAGTVICGFVTSSGSGSGLNGATVRLRSITGTTLVTGITQHDPVSGSDGFYKITVPASLPQLISVDAPVGFYNNYMKYAGATYDQSINATSGGPCIPSIAVTAGQDNRLTNALTLLADTGAPPPPVFVCPRP